MLHALAGKHLRLATDAIKQESVGVPHRDHILRESRHETDRFRHADHIDNVYILSVSLITVGTDIEFDWDEANTHRIASHHVTPGEVEQAFLSDPLDWSITSSTEKSDGLPWARQTRDVSW